jgi:aryl-alcohol dehydrogenase-like predicted oxidoreductase
MSAMQSRPFGRTGRRVSPLGLGTWAMGGDEWGPSDDKRSLEVLRAAIEHGITLIDTADVYGLGHSEELIAEAVPDGSDVILVTKVGWDIVTEPRAVGGSRRRYDRPYLERAVANSLQRLRRDTVDVVLLHNPTRADLASGEAMDTLRRLRMHGDIRWIGASVGTEDDALAALEQEIDVLEVPFNLVRNWARALADRVAGTGVALIGREPFERGLLTGKYGPDSVFSEGDHRGAKGREWLLAAMPAAERIRHIAQRRGIPPAAVALAYPLAHSFVATSICGARSVAQLLANIEGSTTTLDADELGELQVARDS